jgi:type II secretory pathway predicted ATPase ExeA
MADHLSPKANEALNSSLEKRIAYMKSDKWFPYKNAEEILKRMNDLFVLEKKIRMPCMLLLGSPNNGKSFILNRFLKLHPQENDPKIGLVVPVVYVTLDGGGSVSTFYNSILGFFGAPYRSRDAMAKKQDQALELFKNARTKILIVDEVHQMLAGGDKNHRIFLNTLKYIANTAQISIIAAGTIDAKRAMVTDPQINTRFPKVPIPRWKYDDDYLELLATFEHTTPLAHQSNLTEPKLAQTILHMSNGYIGDMSDLINEAALKAIQTGEERITLKLLKSLDWVSPNNRMRSDVGDI